MKAGFLSHRIFLLAVAMSALLYALVPTEKPRSRTQFDFETFAQLPVLEGGRLKPLDSLARNSLLQLSGKQQIKSAKSGEQITAIEWLAAVLFHPLDVYKDPLFEIDEPNVLGLLHLEPGVTRRFSFEQIFPHLSAMEDQVVKIRPIKASDRTQFQSAVMVLYDKLVLFHGLQTNTYPDGIAAYGGLGDVYVRNDFIQFNGMVHAYQEQIDVRAPRAMAKIRHEYWFNRLQPFYKSMVLYVLALVLIAVSWLKFPELNRPVRALLGVAFVVHTLGLIARIYLQGRPPVTNLYSSAIFVGWAAVLLSLVLERRYKNGIGAATASIIGFATLIIAHHLATQGDTFEMMRAVLDSNFWLSTHVVTITLGYSSTFLSGLLGILYLFRRLFDRNWNEDAAAVLTNMAFGVVCFSTFLSFFGTILGGIWADQSWGRFWGWDPKENGALMIVLWNVFILHARWGGLVRQKGFMVLAVFGNVVTSLSWFGVNMLGIGLHSYGFMHKAFVWLMVFVASQLLIMSLGWIKKEPFGRTTPQT